MNNSKVKRILCIALIILIIALLFFATIYVLVLLSIKPTQNDLKFNKVLSTDYCVTSYGDKLEAKSMQVFNSKDNFTAIYVNGESALTIEPAIKNYSTNKIEEDIVDINGEYVGTKERVYVFKWGIIYSIDNGQTFCGTAKYNYDEEYEKNSDFRYIVDMFELSIK